MMRRTVPLLLIGLCLTHLSLADDLTLLRLSSEQRNQLFSRLESSPCTCGCGMTVGQCLREDPNCPVSPEIARSMVNEVLGGSRDAGVRSSPVTQRAMTAGGLDQELVGGWIRRTAGGQGVYYENTLKLYFSADGQVAYGSGVILSGGGDLGSVRGGGDNPASLGRWKTEGGAVHVSWEDGTYGHYPYEVFDYYGEPALMLMMNNSKMYFKSAR